jgi:hypothetical protein
VLPTSADRSGRDQAGLDQGDAVAFRQGRNRADLSGFVRQRFGLFQGCCLNSLEQRVIKLALGTPARVIATSLVCAGVLIASSGEGSWLYPAIAGAGIWALVTLVIALPLGAFAAGTGVLETNLTSLEPGLTEDLER